MDQQLAQPRQRARKRIDLQLKRCGWLATDDVSVSITGRSGVVVREFLFKSGHRFAESLLYAIPLVFLELKNSNIKPKNANDKNEAHYKHDVPQQFHSIAVCVLSKAIEHQ
ncbi:MAG: hypothetical protein Fues2KO_46750 [Fuerstiella sp.]